MPPREKGSFDKWGNKNPIGREPGTDPGCKVYQDSDLALKTNERSLAKKMPVLSEFTFYVDWEIAAKRWAKMLCNHPVSQSMGRLFHQQLGRNRKFVNG